MKRSPALLLIANAILCISLARCARQDQAAMIRSRFKALQLPVEIKLHALDTLAVKDMIDNGPFPKVVHVLGWHETSKEVLALYYISNDKGCIAANIRTYKGGATVTDEKISRIICAQSPCGNLNAAHLEIVEDGQYTCRTEQIYLPCDSTETPAPREATTVDIMRGHVDLAGRVLTRTTTGSAYHEETQRIQAQ